MGSEHKRKLQPVIQQLAQQEKRGTEDDDNWAKISDPRERRRIQNRLSQRNGRSSLKKRIEHLEQILVDSYPPSISSPSNSDVIRNTGILSTSEDLMRNDAITVDQSDNYEDATLRNSTQLEHGSFRGGLEKDAEEFQSFAELNDFTSFDNYPLSPLEPSVGIIGQSQHRSDTLCVPSFDSTTKQKVTEGKSTLHLAVEGGNLKIITLILDSGVSINCRDAHGQTPLHSAALFNWPGVIELLLARGAELSLKDGQGRTPLHVSAQANNEAAVRTFLAKCPSQVDCVDASGKTSLHYAIETNNEKMVQLLLEEGADVFASLNHA